jgi:CRISPR-associated endonuclease/helicase Cas3
MNYYKYWGKTDSGGSYHLLVYHSLDVAAVGKVWLELKTRKNRSLSTFQTV